MFEQSIAIPTYVKNRLNGSKLGELLIRLQRQFPKFNFYADKPDWMTTNDFLLAYKPVNFRFYFEYGQINRWFLGLIKQAESDYRSGDIDKAVWIYETLAEQRYPGCRPYDLLIRHYRRVSDRENELRALRLSISFFTALRDMQKDYVLSLAKDVGKESFALEYINAGKKIHYYGGAFVLYDPVRVMGEWEKQIEKYNGYDTAYSR
jgi:hypothetical protein